MICWPCTMSKRSFLYLIYLIFLNALIRVCCNAVHAPTPPPEKGKDFTEVKQRQAIYL